MLREKSNSCITWALSLLGKHRLALAFALLAILVLLATSATVWAVPARVRVPIVKQHAKVDPQGAGVFSHWQHEQYQCVACHPAIFPRARIGFTHDEMDEGRFCGACHDGRTAPYASGAHANCKTSCHAQ